MSLAVAIVTYPSCLGAF